MKKGLLVLSLLLVSLFATVASYAEGSSMIDTGDTSWVIVSTALVFLMTPGLAFFYGGFVRRKNMVNTLTTTMMAVGIMSIYWIVIGYSLAFGADKGGIIGGLNHIMFNGVGASPNEGSTIPSSAFAMFQMMFAIITPALVIGAFVERFRMAAAAAFILLWGAIVYSPLCHWVWGGGWLQVRGALDFAGGTVVHISAGIAALVIALTIKKRKGYQTEPMGAHNVPFVLLGAALLWFGWYGFNAGSALGANGLAMAAFVNTHLSASAAMIMWMIIDKVRTGKTSLLGACIAMVVGLVAVTPAAGFVAPYASIIIGAVAAAISYAGVQYREKKGFDDSLDVFACHGLGGIWGALATGLFATEAIGGVNGLFYGNAGQFVEQIIAVVATIAFVAIATFLIVKVIGLFTDLTASESEQEEGLDRTIHGEEAYTDSIGNAQNERLETARANATEKEKVYS